jgi:hypothetical protein
MPQAKGITSGTVIIITQSKSLAATFIISSMIGTKV